MMLQSLPALLLTAGASSRMGRPKALLPWRDATVLHTLITTLRRGGADPIAVVTGAHAPEIAATLSGTSAIAVYNPRHSEGMLSSVRCGWSAVPRESAGVLVALIDQPALETATIHRLLAAFAENSACIVVPKYASRRGHPLVLPAHLREAVMSRYDDCGLRGLLRAYSEAVIEVPVADPAVLQDLDTPEEYAAARQ